MKAHAPSESEATPIWVIGKPGGAITPRYFQNDELQEAKKLAQQYADALDDGREQIACYPYVMHADGRWEYRPQDAKAPGGARGNVWVTGKNWGKPRDEPTVPYLSDEEAEALVPADVPFRVRALKALDHGAGVAWRASIERRKSGRWSKVGIVSNEGRGGADRVMIEGEPGEEFRALAQRIFAGKKVIDGEEDALAAVLLQRYESDEQGARSTSRHRSA